MKKKNNETRVRKFHPFAALKRSFGSKNFRLGSMSTLLCVIVIAIAIIVNLVMSSLSTSITQIDLSSNKLYSIGSTTEKILSELEQDVTIYGLYQNGQEDETLGQLIKAYTNASDHIKFETVDPVTNPSFASTYNGDSLSNGSLIIVCGERYKTIDYNDIYETEYSYDDYYSYTTETNFDGEGEITSAIDYVTSGDLPKLYYTTGHNEVELSESATNAIAKGNYQIESLSLLSAGGVPDDCGVLIISAPQSDFSKDEADMVLSYMENGGHVLISTSYTEETLTNFNSIMENYGIKSTQGYVLEGDQDYYYSTPMAILPAYGEHDIVDSIYESQTPAILYQCVGLEETSTRSSVAVTTLLSTTSKAYEKIPVNGNIETDEKESGDKSGAFALSMIAVETFSDGSSAQLVVFSTPYLMEDSLIENYNISNQDLFMNAIGYMCEHENAVTIDTKSLSEETVAPTASSVILQVILFVILLPSFLLVTGVVVWARRRKR